MDTYDDRRVRAKIDEQYTKEWDIEEFDPLELDAHPSQANILVIRLISQILIVSVESREPRLISKFSYDEQKVPEEICESHLVRNAFLTFCSKNFIEIYSTSTMTSISSLNRYE